ncbi:FAD-dependent monooxygenase [Ornithinimicrobium faecis]|uniref:FAD-dependent monooxygenase n=1 Tax=Ornithinimicrobium faecis TaxID=2934158 RepID=A0ABY4YYM9_9MICO|nr:NAD(P)/FAD-dependent oxidoreductase [Ornithinimicrobium sp. HY1793]USQ81555.1 FAD-dependent monooxygenase [Ornithinimicrobium sp. HY1793]
MHRVTIVGGGIAGLALAATLDPQRCEVTVVEARPDRPPAGTTLGMWPAAMGALETAGAADAVRHHGLPVDNLTVQDVDRRLIARTPAPEGVLVSRPDLLAALRSAVPGSVTQLTRTVTDPATLAHETRADLLVGADGVHSVVRRAVWPETGARRVGYLALRGISPEPVAGMTELWHESRICGLSATADGQTNWYVCGRLSEPWPTHEGLGRSAETFATWDDAQAHAVAVAAARRFGPEAGAVISATNPAGVLRQEIWVVPRLRSWRGDLSLRGLEVPSVLVGDAAHAMCPNLGRGACESLVDAAALGRELNAVPVGGSLDEALDSYQRRRRSAARRVQVASRVVLSLSTLRRGQGLRNAALRAVSRPSPTDDTSQPATPVSP